MTTDLGQYWVRLWLTVWWHQAITWTNVDFPVRFIWGQFHKRYLSHQSLKLAKKNYLFKNSFKSSGNQWVNLPCWEGKALIGHLTIVWVPGKKQQDTNWGKKINLEIHLQQIMNIPYSRMDLKTNLCELSPIPGYIVLDEIRLTLYIL